MQPGSNTAGEQPVNLQPCRIRGAVRGGSVGQSLGLELTFTTLDGQTGSSGVVHPNFQACESSLRPVWALEHKPLTRNRNWKVYSRSETEKISWGRSYWEMGRTWICFLLFRVPCGSQLADFDVSLMDKCKYLVSWLRPFCWSTSWTSFH